MSELHYTPVIGLEVHAQLQTQSKLFCGCLNAFGGSPNHQTCPVCLGFPGCLPVVNRYAVELAAKAALALHCTVHPIAVWSRKNYFYPDLPKGYQITQDDQPLATGGLVSLPEELDEKAQDIPITRIHMEEDAGKSIHDEALANGRSWVDFNRGGTPLIEIVSEPELYSSGAAVRYLKILRQLLRALGVCDGNMEEGSLRCDVNVSLRLTTSPILGTRVEIKNVNSFRYVQMAIDYEIARQEDVLRHGKTIAQETRLFDAQARQTRVMRSKESARDYRYFPEPDLPPLTIDAATLAKWQKQLPETPAEQRARYERDLQLSAYDARVLTDELEIAQFFESALATHFNPKAIANWVINELLRYVKDTPLSQLQITGAGLGQLVALVDSNSISGKIAKDLFVRLLHEKGSPKQWVAELGISQVTNVDELSKWVEEVVEQHADLKSSYAAGKTNVLGFLVGQVMKKTKGQANPQIVNQLLKAALSKN